MRTTKHTALLLPLTVPLPYMILPSIILPPLETATPASFTVETTVLPSFALRAAAGFETWEGSSSSHDPNFSRAAASLQDAKDGFKNRPSECSRHDRFRKEWFEDGIVNEVGKEIRRGLMAAFFEGDCSLVVIFFAK